MESEKRTFQLQFADSSVAAAGIKAARLRQELVGLSADATATVIKTNTSTQDPGSTIVLVLGAPAVVAIARGIASFLGRNHAKITISEHGKVVAEGISGEDAARIAEAFTSRANTK